MVAASRRRERVNFRTTLIIVVLLAGIGGAYYLFFQEPSDQTTENEKPPIHQVYGVTHDTVQQVEIAFADTAYQDLKLVKDTAGNWRLTSPFQADADSEKVSQMLDDILNKRVKQTLEVTELAQYGLDTPSITLSLWTAAGTSPTFFIGKKAINFSVYVKEKSETHIFLIESSALDDLTKSPTDLRDRSVIKFNPETVSSIQFTHRKAGASTINCEKRGDTWHVIHPIKAKADAEEIESLLSELRALKVSSFEADGADANVLTRLEKFGLDDPRIQMKLTDGDNTYTLDIGAPVASETGTQGRVYVKATVYQDAIYTVSENIYHLLSKSVFDLRYKRVIDFQRLNTVRIEIKQGEETTVCTKNFDNTWELQTPTGKLKTDPKAVDDLLFGVDALEAVAFVNDSTESLAAYGLASPSIEIAFTQRREEKPAVLLIGDYTQDGTVYVKPEQSNQVTRVKRDLIDNIALGTAWLRDKQVLNFHIDDAIRLTLTLAGGTPFTCQRLGTNWRLTAPVREDANNAEVNAIIYELDDLMADAFVGSRSIPTDAATGFDKPNVELTIELKNQKVYTLQVGNQVDASGRFYARLQHEPNLIFLLSAERIPKLKTTLELVRTSEE
ncbi:hypothetical protein C6503_24810 [Candidatus Poribacteria bacterium]|nr:MAG: hypothetical protein C6503_24810 [Candidatus Poribacteria bacterium]